MTAAMAIGRVRDQISQVEGAHWLLRLPLALYILQQGLMKVPLSADDAAGYGLPLFAWGLAALGEIVAPALLIAGGLFRNWIGDAMTRMAGLGIAMIVAGVLVVAYWAPPIDLILYNQLHVLLLVGGLYFAFRGNHA